MQVIDAQPPLQLAPHEGEAARENGHPVSQPPQRGGEPFGPVHQRHMFQHRLQRRVRQPLQQGHAPAKTGLKIQLAAHGRFGNPPHLAAHARQRCQLVDHLGPDQRGIHIEGHQAAVAAVDIIVLEGDVDVVLFGEAHQGRAETLLVVQIAGGRQFHAHAVGALGRVERRAPGEPVDAIDIEPGAGQDAAHPGQVYGGDLRPQDGDEESASRLPRHPRLILVAGDGGEADLHAQFVRPQQQLGEHRRGLHLLGHLHQNAQRQRVVDHRLADVQNPRARGGQNTGKRMGDARAVVTGDVNEQDAGFGQRGHVPTSLIRRARAADDCIHKKGRVIWTEL